MFERIVRRDAEELLHLCAEGLKVFQKRRPCAGQEVFKVGQFLLATEEPPGLGKKYAQFPEAFPFLASIYAVLHALQQGDAELFFRPFDGKVSQSPYDGSGVEPFPFSPLYALSGTAQFCSYVGDERVVVVPLHILQGEIGWPRGGAWRGTQGRGCKKLGIFAYMAV